MFPFPRCLQFTGYLPKSPEPGELNRDELFFCRLLHHFMRVAYYNTHETVVAEEDGETVR